MDDHDFPDLPITHRTVPLEVRFIGTGALVAEGSTVYGGVVDPEVGDAVQLLMWREVPDEEGLLNPVPGEPTVDGAFQLRLEGTAAGYREVARYLLAIAELDVTADAEFHEHHEVVSGDGRTRLHLIVRRQPEPLAT